jgi:Tfp pilus assembly protein PilO
MDHEHNAPLRIPFAVLITVLVQAAGVLIWATQLDARVGGMEQQVMSTTALNEKFARLEERLENMKQDLGGMKRQLDHLSDRLLKP